MRYVAVDVYYPPSSGARAALVVAAPPTFATVVDERVGWLAHVASYEPGLFFRRELPATRAVLDGLGIRACQAGHRVAFATAAQWVARLADAHAAGKLQAELVKLGRVPLLIIDEMAYIPFEAEAANLFFQLVSSRYERASLIVTSNKPFGRWGEVFGDDVVAAAMIDRLVHHADVISMKGDSYRLKDRDLGRVPAASKPTTNHQQHQRGGPDSAGTR